MYLIVSTRTLHCTALLLLSVFSSLNCSYSRVYGDELSEDLLGLASEMPCRIFAIEFIAQRSLDRALPPAQPQSDIERTAANAPRRLRDSYKFVGSGNLYRVDCFAENGDPTGSYVYNGKTYQFFQEEVRAFGESRRGGGAPSAPFRSPLMWAFAWLVDSSVSKENIDMISNRELWKKAISNSKFVSWQDTSTGRIAVVEVERVASDKKAYLYRIELAEKHGMLPMKWESFELPERHLSTTMIVRNTKTINDADGNSFEIPTSADLTLSYGSGNYTIDPDSIAINRSIGADVFSLQRSAAEIISVSLESEALLDARRQGNKVPFRWRGLIVFVNIIVIACLCVAIWYRYRRHQNTRP